MLILTTAMAGMTASFVVEGETVAIRHDDYCSFPGAPGISTRDLKNMTEGSRAKADLMFDPKSLERDFSGIVIRRDDFPVAALPLRVAADVRAPAPDLLFWEGTLGACRLASIEPIARVELIRKLTPKARALWVRLEVRSAFGSEEADRGRLATIRRTGSQCVQGNCSEFVKAVDNL